MGMGIELVFEVWQLVTLCVLVYLLVGSRMWFGYLTSRIEMHPLIEILFFILCGPMAIVDFLLVFLSNKRRRVGTN